MIEESSRREPTDAGFSLIELMVAIVIVGVLVAIAAPSYAQVRSTV